MILGIGEHFKTFNLIRHVHVVMRLMKWCHPSLGKKYTRELLLIRYSWKIVSVKLNVGLPGRQISCILSVAANSMLLALLVNTWKLISERRKIIESLCCCCYVTSKVVSIVEGKLRHSTWVVSYWRRHWGSIPVTSNSTTSSPGRSLREHGARL